MPSASTSSAATAGTSNAPFRDDSAPADGDLEPIPLWEQPWVLSLAKVLAGLIAVLVLVFSVLKPLLRNLLGPPRRRAGHGPRRFVRRR